MPEIIIPPPRRIWRCYDCNTISDENGSKQFHTGCVGQVHSIKKKLFLELRRPVRSPSGEIIWEIKNA